ncbi:MAG: hypothetical protein AAF420_11820 [Pseudomonadota bacterium]
MTSRFIATILLGILTGFGGEATAREGVGKKSIMERFALGVAVGNFDADTENSDDPHLNTPSYSLMASFTPWRYLGVDAELFHIANIGENDDFGLRTQFGGDGAALSLRARWPIAEDFEFYLRAGYGVIELSDDAVLLDEPLPDQIEQPVFGGGIRGERWFLEYVNQGKAGDLYLEQLRAGWLFRF